MCDNAEGREGLEEDLNSRGGGIVHPSPVTEKVPHRLSHQVLKTVLGPRAALGQRSGQHSPGRAGPPPARCARHFPPLSVCCRAASAVPASPRLPSAVSAHGSPCCRGNAKRRGASAACGAGCERGGGREGRGLLPTGGGERAAGSDRSCPRRVGRLSVVVSGPGLRRGVNGGRRKVRDA